MGRVHRCSPRHAVRSSGSSDETVPWRPTEEPEGRVADFARGEAGKAWNRWEIDAAVAAYVDMLQKERRGEAYVKVQAVRALGQLLPARTSGSIERKFQNISAI